MTTEPTYRKAAKTARAELAETLSSQGIDPKRAHFHTSKIIARCSCGQKRETAKAMALFWNNGTCMIDNRVSVCTCKAESK